MAKFKNVVSMLLSFFFFCLLSFLQGSVNTECRESAWAENNEPLASRRNVCITLDLGMKNGNVLDCQGLSILAFNSPELARVSDAVTKSK